MAADLRRVGYVVDSMDEDEIRKAYFRMDDDGHEALRLEKQGRLDSAPFSEEAE